MEANDPTLISVMANWWREQRRSRSVKQTASHLIAIGWEFLRDSLPDRKRQRFGDIDYDWAHRVNTTSANVSCRSRLIGLFTSSYQPIEPEIFREMLDALAIDLRGFTFVDVGSGKGRALLMASEYPFQRIIGIELLPELNRIAQQNIQHFASPTQRCTAIEAICRDASKFDFPDDPLVVFLFHPLTEAAFRKVIENLATSLRRHPRAVRLIYANPILEMYVASSCGQLQKFAGMHQYSLFRERSQPTIGD
jgi:SAM-dependent methyltransferase